MIKQKIKEKGKHKHNFVISYVAKELIGTMGTSIGTTEIEVAYIICPSCGKVKKIRVENG